MTTQDALRLVVAVARRGADHFTPPEPGDLVVEVTGMRRPVDADGIGWLLAHGDAPYEDDGNIVRDVWDVLPLNPDAKLQTIGGEHLQRWENAQFAKVPDHMVKAAGITPPEDLARLISLWAAA